MPAQSGIFYHVSISPIVEHRLFVPPVIEEEPRLAISPIVEEERRDRWDGKCAELSDRCSSLPNSDCESLASSNSFSECALTDSDDFDNISIPDSDLLSDPEGEQLCPSLLKRIKCSLNKANIHSLRCSKLLLPEDVLRRLGQELMYLAYSEPCGLRGALIDLCVESGKACHTVAQLEVDPSVVPTFQLTVLFKLDSRLWPRIQGLFSAKPVSGQSLKLSPGFKVLKRKLYSSEELFVDEC